MGIMNAMSVDTKSMSKRILKEFVECLLLAAKYREESFDQRYSKEFSYKYVDKCIDCDLFYKLTLSDAVDKASDELNFAREDSEIIYLLLKCAWNDSLEWAEKYLKGE